ncbi:hypothetical protein GWI33_006603 [Rhynchophorus ferrugineus]|uniref:Uncharacterized protein n=1 Tax=Rhynchophorus ferrugineus TaxID=354439 RepID=A0A834MDL6_RHYFE|nr:hypothetical protein GWI33_006603 [Rhynchophorus ferrugineus]
MSQISQSKSSENVESTSRETTYGYVIFCCVTIILFNATAPLASFGIIYGEWMSVLADETTATSMANGVFNTVMCLTGLVANILLDKWTCRDVGLLGAIFTIIGCFSLLFINDLISFIIFFGVFQGFGYGLIFPASLTAMNNSFDKRLTLMMSLSQVLLICCIMVMPHIASFVKSNFGLRGGILLMGGLSLVNIPFAILLTKFQFSYKKVPLKIEVTDKQLELLSGDHKQQVLQFRERSYSLTGYKEVEVQNPGHKTETKMSYSLLKDLKYLNMSMGLSLSFTSDMTFIAIIPVVLAANGIDPSSIALTMSIFFGCDLLARILLSVVSAMVQVKSRHIFFLGTFLSIICRIGFLCHDSLLWKTIMLGALGFLRCFIQTPLPLVVSEQYSSQFATAFSLYMVICGIVNLICGALISLIKHLTNSDILVYHLLTGCYILCVISWLAEMIVDQKKKNNEPEKPTLA